MASKKNNLDFIGKDITSLSDEQRQMVEFFIENPDFAAAKLLVRNDKPCRLAVHQRLIIKGLWNHQFNLLILTRGGGKTFLLALYCVLKAMLYPREKCVVASSSYRQAQFTFDEIIKFWDESPLLRQACEKDPSKGPNSCEMHLDNGSKIIAYPLGDGQKIRGARANTLVMDEVAQIPEDIISLVIIPMMNTRQDPFDTSGRKNHLVMASSAYYQFNHLYQKYLQYQSKSNKLGNDYDPNYGLHVYTVDDMPDNWMDKAIIQMAKESMTELQFQMEYLCLFPPDSDGFFPANLVNGGRKTSVIIEPEGEKGAKYVFGIDPARSGDNFALVVLRLGPPNKIVACYSLNRNTFPQMHEFIRTKLREYEQNGGEVVRIHMDNGGGGQTLKDYLAEEYAWYDPTTEKYKSEPALIDMDDEEMQYMSGRRILRMQVFSSQSINSMNFDLRADLEQRKILIPSQPPTHERKYEIIFSEIEEMIQETMTIVTTPLKNGFHHFDTPKQRMKKDRYSAFLLACQGARELQRELAGPPVKKLARGFASTSYLNGR
ncbi:phage terminase large subunit [Paenibacillus xylanexedens]|uniref:phage terminase large subunit n=1 Tax=Paenibacillus xylanexedens TaxID=528191 RepID=UPI000F51E2F1|nr:phage terminase large subunit [Paenibacillus xylanexedens]RPK20076.1 hypothetical protein EDO6_06593 [Paenibacillus xylanexedens]